jgi:ABC-2 type transport system permease protein
MNTVATAVTFADLLRSEWTKLRSLRSTAYTLLALLGIGIGMSALVAAGTAGRYADLTPEELATFDPTMQSLQSFFLVQLVISVLGVMVVTSEHATGMIRTTLTATPRRGRLLAAKTLVFAGVALVVGQVQVFGAYLLGQAMLAAGGVPHTTLADPGVLRAVVGGGLYILVIGLLAVAIGTLVRATAGAVTVMVGVTLLVPALSSLLPEWARPVLLFWTVPTSSKAAR